MNAFSSLESSSSSCDRQVYVKNLFCTNMIPYSPIMSTNLLKKLNQQWMRTANNTKYCMCNYCLMSYMALCQRQHMKESYCRTCWYIPSITKKPTSHTRPDLVTWCRQLSLTVFSDMYIGGKKHIGFWSMIWSNWSIKDLTVCSWVRQRVQISSWGLPNWNYRLYMIKNRLLTSSWATSSNIVFIFDQDDIRSLHIWLLSSKNTCEWGNNTSDKLLVKVSVLYLPSLERQRRKSCSLIVEK